MSKKGNHLHIKIPPSTLEGLKKALYGLLGVLLLIGIWELIHFIPGQVAFPEFFYTLGQMFLLIGQQKVMVGLGYSLARIIITLVIVFFLGSLIGLLSAFFSPLEKILAPFIYFLTAFPTASIIFVLIIYTRVTCELLVAFLTFPLIYKAALGGGKLILERYTLSIRLEGRYKPKNFFKVLLPLSLPYLSMGLAQATGLGLKAEIMGEVFMSSSRFKGIGVLIKNAYDVSDINTMFQLTLLAILVMSLVELGLYFIKRALNNKYGVEPTKAYHLI